MTGPEVSIVIPTLARAEGLERAVRSLFAQTGVRPEALELVVVDNDPSRSAAGAVLALARTAPFPVRYVWEPRPGVANARNAGVRESSAPLIAFLDDDQVAEPGWLKALIDTQRTLGVEVVFGPVVGVLPDGVNRHVDYFTRFFSRLGPDQDQVLDHWYGCGDSLILRDALPDAVYPFCSSRNRSGGEDDLLFGRMAERGARFGWSAAAGVSEMAPVERARMGYTLRRAFAYGQGPASACAAASPPRPVEAAGWMAKGVVQALVFAGVAAVRAALRRADWLEAMDLAARGVGKVLWFPPFKIAFYGEGALPEGHDGADAHPGVTRYRVLTWREVEAAEQAATAIAPARAARAAGKRARARAAVTEGAAA
ncbi:MAG: glycosyltransferase family 2 protein [Proteobacteria bacterium]|nr:glycosyltransferase family 2 protein [Pseudomonadota bacterium]